LKVGLVDPLHRMWEFFRGYVASPGLTAMAAWIRHLGHDVVVCDVTVLESPWADFHRWLIREQPEVIGLTSNITMLHHDPLNAARLVRAVLPDAKIMVGGVHAAALPEMHLSSGLFDAVVLGEGEITAEKLLNAWATGADLSTVPGIAYMETPGRMRTTPRPALLEDLTTLPDPAYDLFPMDNYFVGPLCGREGFAVTFSRGCNYKCSYCPDAAHWGHTIRQMSPEQMVRIWGRLSRDYGRRVFYVGDDNFLFDRARVEKLIDLLEKNPLDINFWIQATCTHTLLCKDLLKRLNKVGCYQILLGIETVDKAMLEKHNKMHNFKTFEAAVAAVDAANIITFGMLLWGHPDDTKTSLRATLDYLGQHTDVIAPNICTPYPGTALWTELEERGIPRDPDFRRYDHMHCVVPTAGMTMEEAEKHYGMETGRALMFNPKLIRSAFTSDKHPLLKVYIRRFFKMGARLAIQRTWVQDNWESYESYLRREFRIVDKQTGVAPAKSKRSA
jgi:anaerobic magnesium-protoporphyrin IX monomethyl ester cyclase